jgi:hypothetical protein
MENFFRELRIPEDDVARYVCKLVQLGYDDVLFLQQDVSEVDLATMGVKPGHIKRIIKKLNETTAATKEETSLDRPSAEDENVLWWDVNAAVSWLSSFLREANPDIQRLWSHDLLKAIRGIIPWLPS